MSYVHAQAPIETVDDVATLRGLEGLVENITRSLLYVAAIVLFVMLLVGGFKFITSGGDPKGLDSARKTITYALIGIILIACAYLVLVLIRQITGNTNILNFEIRVP
jgi:TRAP-type C4-dicarboxylate transport system permease small subunit